MNKINLIIKINVLLIIASNQLIAQNCDPPDVTAFALSSSCTNGTPNDNGYLQISEASSNATHYAFTVGNSYSGSGFLGATAFDPNVDLPLKFGTLVNPDVATDYTIRIFSGTDGCFTDVVVTLEVQDCVFGCNCAEHLYLNDTGTGEVHKFSINTTTGEISEIGSPWMSGFDNPHGLGTDLNGNLYIGDDTVGPIYKINCNGGSVSSDATIWFDNIENGLTNIGSYKNYILTNANQPGDNGKYVTVHDACTSDVIGQICLNDTGDGPFSSDWGLQVLQDGTVLLTDGQGFSPDPDRAIWKFKFDPSLINSDTCIDAFVKSADNNYLTGVHDVLGITTDGNFLYIITRDPTALTTLLKIDATTGDLVSSVTDTPNDGAGWHAALGLVYAPSSGFIYISGFEDCIAIVDPDDLSYVGPGNGTIPFGSVPKAISINTECCPINNNVTIDSTICVQAINDLIFLQELTKCNGTLCEGVWQEGADNIGLTFNTCDNSVSIDALNACGSFILNSDGIGNNAQCGAFVFTVNIDVENIVAPVISGTSPDCQSENDPDPLVIDIPASGSGSINYVWQSSITSCTDGFSDIAGAPTDGTAYDPPVIDETTYYRMITSVDGTCSSGSCRDTSNCIVLMPASNCCESLGGVVFIDGDEDGCQANAVDGYAGISVHLYVCEANGMFTQLSTTTTDAGGSYAFGPNEGPDNLCLDPTLEYRTQISAPAGYNFTSGVGSGCSGDEDDSPANDGISDCYNPSDTDVGDTDTDEHIDFGIFFDPILCEGTVTEMCSCINFGHDLQDDLWEMTVIRIEYEGIFYDYPIANPEFTDEAELQAAIDFFLAQIGFGYIELTNFDFTPVTIFGEYVACGFTQDPSILHVGAIDTNIDFDECTFEVPCIENNVEVCFEGDAVTLSCDQLQFPDIVDVNWFDAAGNIVGTGCNLQVDYTMVADGSVGDITCFYYEGISASFESAVKGCPSFVTVVDCPCTVVKTDVISEGSVTGCLIPGELIERNIVTDDSEILPPGYQILYILVNQAGTIVTSNSLSFFNITTIGSFTAYSVAFNPVDYDVTTATTFNDIITNLSCGDISAGLPMVVYECCQAFAGNITQAVVDGCAGNGSSATLTWTTIDQNLPSGYVIEYILTDGATGLILQTSAIPSFTVGISDFYKVHSVVFLPSEFSLTGYANGTSTVFNINGGLTSEGLCSDVNLIGQNFVVYDCCSQDLYLPGIGTSIPAGHYERDLKISSDGLVDAGSTDFDSGIEIELLPGFEVAIDIEFHAYIDGCN